MVWPFIKPVISEMMKNSLLLFLVILFAAPCRALNFDSTALRLHCPSRGVVEVTLHAYGHVSELWEGHYEVGAGHHSRHGIELVDFTNGDQLIHRAQSYEFLFHYAGKSALQRCQKLSESPVYAVNLPWHR